jgi:hypothetical protein
MATRGAWRLLAVGALLASGAAVAAPAAKPFKLALPAFSYVNVEDKAGDFFLDYFAQQLQLRGVTVTTKRDVAAILGMERQREYLNCAVGTGECVAELSGALGVDALIVGSLAKTGSGYVINLKIVGSRDARSLAVFSTRVKSDEALLDYLQASAREFVASLPTPPPVPGAKPSLAPFWISSVIAGGALVAVGGGSYAFARVSEAQLAAPTVTSYAELQHIRRTGELQQTIAFIAGGVGLAALGAGVLLWTLDARPPRVSVAPTNGGALLVVNLGDRL